MYARPFNALDDDDSPSRYVPVSDLEAMTRDRNEWHRQHELLLAMFRAEEVAKIEAQARVRELESELSPARSQGQRLDYGMLTRDLKAKGIRDV
jgi:hypothetical protein